MAPMSPALGKRKYSHCWSDFLQYIFSLAGGCSPVLHMQRKLYPAAAILHRLSSSKVQYEDLRFIRLWMQIGAHVERYPGVVVACKTREEDHRRCCSSSTEELSLQRVNLICAGDRLPWGALQGCEVQPCSINTFDSITGFNIFCRFPREKPYFDLA